MLEDDLSSEKFQEQFNRLWQGGHHGEALVLAQDFAHKLDTVGEYCAEAGDFENAEICYQTAMKIYRPLLKMHPSFAASLHSLAHVYYQTGEYEKAETCYQEALEIWRSTLGETHPYVASVLNNLAQLSVKRGHYDKAYPLQKQALEFRQQAVKDAQDDLAESLDNLAMLEYRLGRYRQAEPLFQEALALRRRMVGEHHPDFALVLNNISLVYEARGDYQKALAAVRQACEIWHNTVGEMDPRFASCLNNLGVLLQELGNYTEAEQTLLQALELRRRLFAPTDPSIADTLNNLARLNQETGMYEKAEQGYREALTLYQSLPGDEHFEIAQSLDNLASLCVVKGEYKQAEDYYHQALEMTRHTLGPRHPAVARCLNSIAVLDKIVGQYERAHENLSMALDILQSDETEHPLLLLCLDNLAAVYYAQGSYAQAETYYQQALTLRRATLGEEHPDNAQSFNSLAVLYRVMGDNAKAQDFYQQALRIVRTAFGAQHPDVAQILNNLALLYDAQNDLPHEEELLLQAYQIWQATLPENHPTIATVLDNLATVSHARGDYAQAEQRFTHALAMRRAALGNEHLDVALSLNNLGVLYDAQGQYGLAEPLYQEALAIQHTTLKDSHPDMAQTLRNLAGLYAATQRYSEALAILQQAATMDDHLIGQIFSLGSEHQRLTYLTTLQESLDGFLSLIVRYLSHFPEAVQAGFALVLRRKAMSAEALFVQRDAILRGRYPHLRPHLDRVTLLRAQIGQKILQGAEPEEQAVYQDTLSTWRLEQEHLESELAHQIPEMNIARQLEQADRRMIAAALPPETFLVEFVSMHPVDFQAVPAQTQTQWQPTRYLAFLLQAREPDALQMIDLGEASVIDAQILAFRSAIIEKIPLHRLSHEQGQPHESTEPTTEDTSNGTRNLLPPEARKHAEQASTQSGLLLRRAIFDPLIPALHGCTRLFIAPEGDLAWIPFETLPTDDGRYLVDDYHITYLTTGRDVLRFTTSLLLQPAPALIVADPDFDLCLESAQNTSLPVHAETPTRRSGDIGRGSLHFSRLPGTRAEGEQIAALLQVEPLVQQQALDALIKAYRSPHILHMATHGLFLADQPRVEKAQTRREVPDTEDELVGNRLERLSRERIENPLLRSGLVLAGINTWSQEEALPEEAEDGLLTAEDIAGMDLTGTELAVLSACETGLGQVHIGEGIFGLRRAFLLAGVKTIVISLWKVDDEQTQVLMLDFYQRILQGQPRAEALRSAQLALKRSYPHPFYWGAFICQGAIGPLAMRHPEKASFS